MYSISQTIVQKGDQVLRFNFIQVNFIISFVIEIKSEITSERYQLNLVLHEKKTITKNTNTNKIVLKYHIIKVQHVSL